MKYCPKCKTEYPDQVAICPLDGTTLQSTQTQNGIKCQDCKTINGPGSKFCTNCGSKLESSPAQIQCPKCKEMLPANSHFCSSCGYQFSAQHTPDLPDAPPSSGSWESEEQSESWDQDVVFNILEQNNFNLRNDPDARLKATDFNLMRLKLMRANNVHTGIAVSPEVLEVVTSGVDSYLSGLSNELSAQVFLPYARQAAAYWIYTLAEKNLEEEIVYSPLTQKYITFPKKSPQALVAAFNSWAYLIACTHYSAEMFFKVETAFGKNIGEFAKVVCQSIRESCYLSYPTLELRKRFLSEEDWKLNHGYYPDSIKNKVSQVLSSLHKMSKKWEQVMQPSSADEENLLLMRISPLLLSQIAIPLNLGTRNFTQEEQETFEAFQSYGIDTASLIMPGNNIKSFFRNFLHELDAEANNVGMGNPAIVLFDVSYIYLWRYNVILSDRRIGEKGYDEAPPLRNPLLPGTTWNQVAVHAATFSNDKNNSPLVDQELVSALMGQYKTIEHLFNEIT